ncbi:MAG TPA: GT4 family glycosyltransferase PelF [Spirochaetia bacterium]|nr:GT4 family glycosyltransferase PelF [Spirochaetia bacterium]
MRVCLVIEGSYPFITGGVSSWVHELIGGLPGIEFALYTFSPAAKQELRYKLPPNVVEHVDVVLTEAAAPKSAERPARRRGEAVRAALAAHLRMFAGSEPELLDFIGSIPEGHSLRRDSVLDKRAWVFIGAQNRRRNPLYPFSDYFWAWKGAHDLLFNVLSARAPEADLYHSVSTGFAGLAALAAKVRRGKPFLLTEHGLYHKEREIEIRKASFVKGYQRDLWTRIYDRIASLCYRNADLCTSLFAENRGYQLALGASPERAVVIPNGIDVKRFSVARRAPDGLFHVGFVGRVVPIKDVRTFLLAAKLLVEGEAGEGGAGPAAGPAGAPAREARFHIIGPDDEDPGYAAECRRLVADLKLEDRIEFTGRKNVLEYYAFLDLVVLTSVREAQPLVILEAYAAGIPAVSTDVGNVSELLEGDRRFIAPVKDAEGVAAAMAYVRDHPGEIAELAARNRARTLATYEKGELLARYGELYERFASPDSASPNAPHDAPRGEAPGPAEGGS